MAMSGNFFKKTPEMLIFFQTVAEAVFNNEDIVKKLQPEHNINT